MIDAPPARRLLLGAALRRYRENLGFGLEDAAHILECDRSKISRIETGQRGIRPKELRELLTEYGVGASEQGALATLAQTPHRDDWWQEYGDAVPESYREFLALELAASEIAVYDAQQVPDLLQTQEYAQAVLSIDPTMPLNSAPSVYAEVKRIRQQMILSERRPRLAVVIGEGALRQVTGRAEVMHEQIKRLAEINEDTARIIIQVLPFTCGAPSSGPATILRFAGTSSLGAVYLPGLSGGVCLVGQQDVASYTRAFEHLRASALTLAESAQFLRETADRQLAFAR